MYHSVRVVPHWNWGYNSLLYNNPVSQATRVYLRFYQFTPHKLCTPRWWFPQMTIFWGTIIYGPSKPSPSGLTRFVRPIWWAIRWYTTSMGKPESAPWQNTTLKQNQEELENAKRQGLETLSQEAPVSNASWMCCSPSGCSWLMVCITHVCIYNHICDVYICKCINVCIE